MSELFDTFAEECATLDATLVESPTFNGRVSHFLYHVKAITAEIHSKPDSWDKFEAIVDSLVDLIRLMKSTISKKVSKNELVDCIIKRPKFHEEFRRLESQLFALVDSTPLLERTKSKLNNTIMQHFINEIDWQNNKKLLLSLSAYIDCSKDFSLKEHVESILTLIAYLNNQPTHQSCTIRLLSVANLEESSLRFLNTLLDPITATSNMAVKPVEHAPARQTSIFSAFASVITMDHGVHEEEHHSAVYCGFGQCYRAVWNGALVAIKKMTTGVFAGGAVGLREAATAMQANSRRIKTSPFLATLIAGSADKEGFAYFVTPLAPLGCLYDVVANPALENVPAHQRVRLSPVNKLSVLMDVIAGISHLHSHGFVHGRLKDSNVLLYEGYRAKLSDFGVHTFFSNESRLNLKGTRGVRWTPPEVYLQELAIEAALKASRASHVPTLEEVAHHFPYALAPATDIYCVGILVLVLLSEKMPFSNIPFEEGVRHSLEAGVAPAFAGSSYPDRDKLSPLEASMYQCIGGLEERPTQLAGLLSKCEELYCNLDYSAQEELLRQRNEEIDAVQKEIKEIKVKVKDHVQLISRGREIINKRDADKIMIHNAKDRKQAELDIDKARAKLRTFEEELAGQQEDLDGAEHDVGELFKLRAEIQTRLEYDKRHALNIRQWVDNFDQEELLLRYCTERERDRIAEMIASADSLEELVIDAGTEYGETPLGVASRLNPFLNQRDGSTECSAEQRRVVEKTMNDGVYEYQHLADQLDTIFRVPLNPNLLPTQLKNIEAKLAAQGAKASNRQYYLEEEEEEDIGADFGFGISAAPAAALSHQQSQQMPAPVTRQPTISSVPPITSKPSVTIAPAPAAKPAPAPAAKTVSPLHAAPTAPLPKTAFTAVVSGEADSDDEDSDNDQDYEEGDEDGDGYGEQYGQQQHQDDYYQDADEPGQAMYAPSMHYRATEQLLYAQDDFPSEEDDIVHCQYLAASRGDWEEAVGMRRHGLGFSDLQIQNFLETEETPAHIAAALGHVQVFRELIELGGVEANSPKTDGNTPMHCACLRGHLNIVMYLTESHNVPATEPNKKEVTPVQLAASRGSLPVLRYFLELSPLQVPLTYKDSVYGASLLHWACLNDRTDVVEYLLYDQHMPVEFRASADDSTCVLWAAYGGSLELLQYLIEQANADPKVKSKQGSTCLHMATASGSVEKAVYLMEKVRLGITDKDVNNKSPFDLAVGKCAIYLNERKARGFVVGSVVEKTRKIKAKHLQEKG